MNAHSMRNTHSTPREKKTHREQKYNESMCLNSRVNNFEMISVWFARNWLNKITSVIIFCLRFALVQPLNQTILMAFWPAIEWKWKQFKSLMKSSHFSALLSFMVELSLPFNVSMDESIFISVIASARALYRQVKSTDAVCITLSLSYPSKQSFFCFFLWISMSNVDISIRFL